ncbi:MAG TPA: inositol monophosphatase [Stellaceae bacterium]|nr:inositol monophosphatase [Stellaceae bacterium]
MFSHIDTIAPLIRETAATEILPRFERLEAADIHEKGPGDLVTVADLASERMLTQRLRDLVPGALIVGEEATAADAAVLDRLTGDEPVFVIDPIDGTSNFAAGIPLFAVMVAYVRGGEILASWIYDPVRDLMAEARAGAGATLNGRPIRVAPTTTPENMSGSFSVRYGNRQLVRKIAGRSNLVGSTFSFRCAGQEYLAMASGKVHFALYHRLMPWDHAPGWLLHREAGGFSRRLDQSAYSPRHLDGGLLLAPDETSWQALHAVLIG